MLAHDQGLAGPETAFNIVVMGMGEPLHNYDATMAALRIVGDKAGLAVPARRITLSTVGLVPGIEKLGREPFMPNLAISLHASHEDQRDALVPINRKYDLEALIDACKRFPVNRRSRITFEYVLLQRRQRHARRRAPAGQAARRHQGQGQPAAAERGAGHPVRAARRRARRRLREDPRRQGPHRVGAEEPRPRHPRRLRPADRRRRRPRRARHAVRGAGPGGPTVAVTGSGRPRCRHDVGQPTAPCAGNRLPPYI